MPIDHDAEVQQLERDLADHVARDAHPLLIAARQELLAEAIQRRNNDCEELRRLGKAILLAPTIEVCEALMRGEQVPLSKLRPERVRRLGMAPQ